MSFIYVNNLKTTLLEAVDDIAEELTLVRAGTELDSVLQSGNLSWNAGDGTADEVVPLTLVPAGVANPALSDVEVVYVVGGSAPTVQVKRGQAGTTAKNWEAGDTVGCFLLNDAIYQPSGSVKLGGNAAALYDGAVSIGFDSHAYNEGAVAIGNNGGSSATNAVSVGTGSDTTGASSLALGHNASAKADYGVAIGSGSLGVASRIIALGVDTEVSGDSGVAIGDGAACRTPNSISIGTDSESVSPHGISIGTGAFNAGGVALGRNANTTTQNGVALGEDTTTTAGNQVHVGDRDLELGTDTSPRGIHLYSPDGTRYKITVDDTGALSATADPLA